MDDMYQYLTEKRYSSLSLNCDFSIKLAYASDVYDKLIALNNSPQGGDNDILQLKEKLKLLISKVEMCQE